MGNRFTFFIAAVLVCSLPFLASCGKKAWPEPPDTSASFNWVRAKAVAEGGCLKVDAELSGNTRNVDFVVLELQTAGNAGDCPGCPFNPDERAEFSDNKLGISSTQKDFTLRYCPTRPSSAYRWRLVGVNVHDTLNHVVSSEHSLNMQ